MNKTSLQRRHCERERPSRGLRILPQDFSILHLASQGCYSVHSTWLQRHWGVLPNKSKATHFEMLDRNYKRISQTLPEKKIFFRLKTSQNSLSQPQKHCFLGLHSQSLLYEQNTRLSRETSTLQLYKYTGQKRGWGNFLQGVIPRSVRLIWRAEVKRGASHNKHWAKSTKYASCISSR